jgi:hypothetical protein
MKLKSMRELSSHVFLAFLAVAILLSLTTLGLLTMSQTISSSGTITSINVAVFSDSACTTPVNTVSWGLVSPGTSVSRTVYVKNTGNSPLTLNMRAESWGPSGANNSISLTWNRENAQLNADQSTAADLTLTVSPSISGILNFSVNIIIIGSG